MSRVVAAVALLFGAGALAQQASTAKKPGLIEVFVDKGDTFIRAGSNDGLGVGSSVKILGDTIADTEERRTLGVGTVMEVWPSLARVRLDQASAGAQGDKFATIEKKAPRPKPAPAPAAATTVSTQPANPNGTGGEYRPTPPPPPPADEKPAAKPRLKGRAELSGVGPAKRVVLYNRSAQRWTNCELRLPDNRRFMLGHLDPGDSEGVMAVKFAQDGVQYDRPYNQLAVTCNEGSAVFEL